MAKIINLTDEAIPLPTGHVVPPNGTLEIGNDVIRGDAWPMLNGKALAGQARLEMDDAPPVEARTTPVAGAPTEPRPEIEPVEVTTIGEDGKPVRSPRRKH